MKKKKENKIKRIYLRCTQEEYDTLLVRSDGFKNISDFIRKLVFSKSDLIIEPKTLIHVIDELAKQLNGLGNNLNQTARYINYAEKQNIVSENVIAAVRKDYKECKDELEKWRIKLNEIIDL